MRGRNQSFSSRVSQKGGKQARQFLAKYVYPFPLIDHNLGGV